MRLGWLGRIDQWLPPGTVISLASVVYALPPALIPFMLGLWCPVIPGLVSVVAQGVKMPSIRIAGAGTVAFAYRASFAPTNATIVRGWVRRSDQW